jgi:hypothetical protein
MLLNLPLENTLALNMWRKIVQVFHAITQVGRENGSDLVLALPRDRNADRVSIEHRTIRELHGSAVGAIMWETQLGYEGGNNLLVGGCAKKNQG